jgi:hypothetical protein
MKHTNLLLTLMLLPTSQFAFADHPDPSELRIENIEPKGSGCPDGSVTVDISDDAKALTVLFDDYVVDTEDSRNGYAKKNCNLDIHLHTSSGWQFGFFEVDFRGYADLDKQVSGKLSAGYKFGHGHGNRGAVNNGRGGHGGSGGRGGNGRGGAGNWRQAKRLGSKQIKGSFNDDYEQHLSIPYNLVTWSPCNDGKTVHFQLQSTVSVHSNNFRRTGNGGLMTVDSVDAEMIQKYKFAWRRCDTGGGGHHGDDDDDHGDDDDDHGDDDDDHGDDDDQGNGHNTVFQAQCSATLQMGRRTVHTYKGFAKATTKENAKNKALNNAYVKCKAQIRGSRSRYMSCKKSVNTCQIR